MATLYTICTESTGPYRQNAIDVVATTFDGFSVTDTTGYYKGTREESITIAIVADDSARARVYAVAEAIRETNKQETVLVTECTIDAVFIGAEV